MEKESEIQLLEALDQLEVCFSECVSASFMLHLCFMLCGNIVTYTEKSDLATKGHVFTLGPSTVR